MKKITAILLVFVLMFAFTVTASAEEVKTVDTNSNKGITVTYLLNQSGSKTNGGYAGPWSFYVSTTSYVTVSYSIVGINNSSSTNILIYKISNNNYIEYLNRDVNGTDSAHLTLPPGNYNVSLYNSSPYAYSITIYK